ncbi:MAG TPA: phospholipase D family protein [Steroidobacteraceae bacterium]|nr:phospholipase D family protein [Steroidobacteraceae bacterium]
MSIADFTTGLTRSHAGLSGVLALADGRRAFAARAQLIEAAQHGIDCQYYIWRNDMSGQLLLDALRRAAQRGVRVRLLLDDHNTDGLDALLAAHDSLPNFEVRLFNPHRFRSWRIFGLLADFARLNRRMHNKSFTVDGAASIVGGRNVGDEYFGANAELAFVDLDVLVVGEAAAKVARDFERYWTSRPVVPLARVIPVATHQARDAALELALQATRSPEAIAFAQGIAASPLMRELRAGTLPLEWARTWLVSDPPAKGVRILGRRKLLMRRLQRILGAPRRELLLISAYFVPTRRGMRLLLGLARRGVRITVLTNSLEATDVTAVHAGYAGFRKTLLKAGVSLYEMKRRTGIVRNPEQRVGESSASSLHAKAFCVDRARVFIGSFNFDARSVRLNTEMGLVIDSAKLADLVGGDLATERFLRESYQVRLGESGRLLWLERTAAGEIFHTREPNASLRRRLVVRALSMLRIRWLL